MLPQIGLTVCISKEKFFQNKRRQKNKNTIFSHYSLIFERVTKLWVCIYRPGSIYRPFLILGSVKGLYFMKKVCILTKLESNGKFILTKYVESK